MNHGILDPITSQNFLASMNFASNWLIEVAQKHEDKLTIEKNNHKLQHFHWKGSIRGEYSVANKEWSYFCPIWHTGQAIKALANAYHLTQNRDFLNGALLGAEFILQNTNCDPNQEDFGMIHAYEDSGNISSTSATLEACDGLLTLSRVSGDEKYKNLAINAVKFLVTNLYLDGEGLFQDGYDPVSHSVVKQGEKSWIGSRPLNDDAILLKVGKLSNDAILSQVFYEICERLIADEDPKGNWITYKPCSQKNGNIHPRHAYWWGRPFINAYLDSKEERYLEIAQRAGEWYMKAMRHDGGLFRNTYVDFNTDSFGHATSGVACAVLLWNDLYFVTQDPIYISYIKKGLEYCQKLQFTMPEDENLYQCILEKIVPFNGTDKNPYYVRDLGTIFYIQAVSEVLNSDLSNASIWK